MVTWRIRENGYLKKVLPWIRDLRQSTAVSQVFNKTSGKKAADLDWQEQDGLFSSECQFLDFHH